MTFRIMHEAPSAPGISVMEVKRIEALSAESALMLFSGAKKCSVRADGVPCINYGFGKTILRQYTAIPVIRRTI